MTLYETMLSQYQQQDGTSTPNAEHEVMQQIALAGLYRGGFFQHAAFYGGTCLRLFHNLPRFSEDMDFSLIEKRDDIHLENYFQPIIEEFRAAGHEVEIVKKDKKIFGRVESAFLKEGTETYDLKFQTRKMVKIKIELDTNPPLLFNTEQKLLLMPSSFQTRCITLPDLYAGKMHALVYRAWQRRIKGRDWYDFEWYVRHKIPLDFNHLQERIREFSGNEVTKEEFLQLLREKLSSSNIDDVKRDVVEYVFNEHDLDIWSNDYFLQLADMIVFL